MERKEAKALGLKTYNTGRPCGHGHSADRFASSGGCVECTNVRRKAYVALTPERYRGYVREGNRKWVKRNPAKNAFKEMSRKAAKLRATPIWADAVKMLDFYKQAREVGMHVDHVVPLKSKVVCGLHCEFNLQLLPPKENMSKGNHFHV